MTDDPTRPASAVPPPPPPPAEGLSGERHVSEVAGRPIVSKRAGIGVIVAGAIIACAVILLTSARPNLKTAEPSARPPKSEFAYVAPPLPAPPVVLPAAAPPPLPDQPAPSPTPAGAGAPAPRRADLLVYSSNNGGGRAGPGA